MPRVPTVVPDGERIREAREALKLSREELAARMERHRHWKPIAQIEQGKKGTVSRQYIGEMAAALGKPVEELIRQDAA